jgi:MFS family permease
VLVPQPSASVNDPLNWPQCRKHFVYLQVLIFTFFTNASIGGLSPGFYILSLEFNKSINTTSGLLTWPILTLGLSVGCSFRDLKWYKLTALQNFFWVPFALYFGKRPVLVTATFLLMIANIWGANAETFNSLLASRIVGAFAGASTEALGAAIVNVCMLSFESKTPTNMIRIYISSTREER